MNRTRRLHAPAWGRAVLLVLVLGGLFAMHGLDQHGTGDETSSEMHASSAVVSAVDVVAPEVPSMHEMTGMCVAVLAGLVLLLLPSRRSTDGVPARPPSVVRRVVRRGRDRDPPCLRSLSVYRC